MIIQIIMTRSYLYLGPPTGSQYNCRLYHMDHWTLPDGDNIIIIRHHHHQHHHHHQTHQHEQYPLSTK